MALNIIKDETSFVPPENAPETSQAPVEAEKAAPATAAPEEPAQKEAPARRKPRAQSMVLSDEDEAVRTIHAFLQGMAKGPEVLASFTELVNEKNARIKVLEEKLNKFKELVKEEL